jgi:hypothetical protein
VLRRNNPPDGWVSVEGSGVEFIAKLVEEVP